MILHNLVLRILNPFVIFLALVITSIFIEPASAAPEFSGQTGHACSACHKNPDGGGPLTLRGERYKADGYIWDEEGRPGRAKRLLRLFLGFIHVLVGVVWFGSIIYVHLIIKPQSLVGGMPKSEKLMGRVCIVAVGLSGIGLTLLKLETVRELWTTSFGLIWMIKVGFYLLMVVVAAVATTTIDRKLQQIGKKSGELKANGKKGRPAHIIYNRHLYDVTGSKLWKDGVHMARHFAGSDLTEAIEAAPHGPEVLERVKDLGRAKMQDKVQAGAVLKAFVGLAYFVLFCVLVVLLCVAWWKWGPPIIDAFPSWSHEKASACLNCHHRQTPAIHAGWAASVHAKNKVSCLHCHQAADSDPDVSPGHSAYFREQDDVRAVAVSSVVSPRDCARCHFDRVQEFERSKHAKTVRIVRQIDPWLKEGRLTPVERATGCEACHGSGLGGRVAAPANRNYVVRGIGRLNPDGSKGNCGACHGRHVFSSAQARRAEACGQCHVGPEHPQMEIYRESKHGAVYNSAGNNWKWESAGSTWTAGLDYRTPACAACHISGAAKTPANHDVGHRLSWELQAPLTAHPVDNDWRAARLRMEEVCLQCHSRSWTKSHFVRLDRVVEEYNRAYYEPMAKLIDELYKNGGLDRTRLVDEPLEIEADEFWRREGRRAKMGAAMMAPDYTWWHGFYELKKHYSEIKARAVQLKLR